MASNYPPGVTGSEPEITGLCLYCGRDGSHDEWCPNYKAPTCCICGQAIAEGHVCTDCDRELRESAERDAATDKSDWPF